MIAYSVIIMYFWQLNVNRLNELKKYSIFILVCSFITYGTCIDEVGYLSKVKPILDKLDLSVDPCEDFYEYVCGHLNKSEIPKTSSHIDLFQTIFDRTAAQMIKLASEDINPGEPKIYQLIKTYYQSCTDSTSIENRGLRPLWDILDVLGGWPVVLGDAWDEENFTWEKTDRILKSLGYNPKYIFHIDVMKDEYHTSKNILCVRNGILFPSKIARMYNMNLLPWRVYNIDESETHIKDLRHHDYLLKAYKDYMVNVALLLGANEEYAIRELNETFQFEFELWSISHYALEEISESTFDRLSIAELQDRHPYVQWFQYLNYMTFPNILSKRDLVCIENPTYLHAIENLLSKTPKRIIANYMIWRTIDSSALFLNKAMRDRRLQYSKVYNGITEDRPNDERCIKMMMDKNNALYAGISAMYVNNYFKNDTRAKVAEIVSAFKESYENVIEKSWLDDGTKVRALRKIALMEIVIGFPDELLDLNFIDCYYKNLHLEPNQFFENSLKLHSFSYENNMNTLKKSPNDIFWLHAAVAALVDAHYDVLHNAVVISASLLQYPNYDENQPDYMNYGNLGTIIAHEITHGLTFGEFPWDEYGSKMRWWTIDDQNQYVKRAECFLKQFQNYTKNTYLASLTFAENVADTEAAKIGFKTYAAWKKKKGEKGTLYSVNHTDEQLYWINNAHFMCSKSTEELINFTLFTDTHATEKLRVNMGVANSVDFSKSFACPIGSSMNPVEKCSLW